MKYMNEIILLVQVVILIGQLLLSRKINIQTISREKGYFLIEKTNAQAPEKELYRFRDQFDLLSNRGIGFHVIKGDVVLRSSTYCIDGIAYQIEKTVDTFFTEHNRFNKLTILLDLKEYHLQKDYLDVEFVFNLKNTVGYKYTEKVNVRFSKMENDTWYLITKYNMYFDK